MQGWSVIDFIEASARIVADTLPPMKQLRKLVTTLAPTMINVLIVGETGVGKEILAEEIHRASNRARGPFVRLNCAALSESLLESELFGYERGAFTGAVAAKQGLLETAAGGTVFLDEVGEMPLSIQAKLLRVIEERVVLPVGGLKPRAIDVRFIAATHRDLLEEIDRGAFREDLFYRLDGISMTVPPLRERIDEIAGLARLFIARLWCTLDRQHMPPRLSIEALRMLEQHPWPGNVRELKNVIERAVLLCDDGAVIEPEQVIIHVRRPRGSTPPLGYDPKGYDPKATPPLGFDPKGTPPPPPPPVNLATTVRREVASLERERIIAALAQTAGNQTHAAKLLGISRATFVTKLALYGIDRPRKDRAS
jgi:transcriptional regulator with PAS, ATPase and Fis domain